MNENNFTNCLALTLAQECPVPNDWSNARNFSDDRGDSGGATMCGITQREYDSWRKLRSESTRMVREITRTEGEAIYAGSYWLPLCPLLPKGLDLCLFDASVNEGSHAGLVIFQDALHVAPDGKWGPLTLAAVHGAQVGNAIQRFTLCRIAAYRRIVQRIPRDAQFEKDWLRRAQEIGNAALAMAQGRLQQATLTAPSAVTPGTLPTAQIGPLSPTPPTPNESVLDRLRAILGDLTK